MNDLLAHHKNTWTREFSRSAFFGLLMFLGALAVNYAATIYATAKVSLPVTDILLSNLPVWDVDEFLIFAELTVIVLIILLLFYEPKKLPFVLKSVAIFIVVRSVFITLTHIAPFTPHVATNPSHLFQILGLGSTADLFFSGHAGMPFLLALVYWNNKILRYVFIGVSLVFAAAVILGHLHYSIDVLAAYFITDSIFDIAKTFFRKDWEVAVSGRI